MREEAKEYFEKGRKLFEEGEFLAALASFEKAYSLNSTNRVCQSYIALLMATERGQIHRAITLMEGILQEEPREPEIYLNLGRLYLKAGKKSEAIEIIRKGLAIEPVPEGIKLLENLGTRRKPVFTFLPRNHFINKYAGLVAAKLGFR